MKRAAYVLDVMAVVAVAFFTSSAGAEESQLPKSGTAHVHSGWAGIGEAKEVGKNHLVWLGTYYGTSFNDAGKGFMNKVAWICHGASEILDGAIVLEGFCTTTDATAPSRLSDSVRPNSDPGKLPVDLLQWVDFDRIELQSVDCQLSLG